jgi:hypothetical protein
MPQAAEGAHPLRAPSRDARPPASQSQRAASCMSWPVRVSALPTVHPSISCERCRLSSKSLRPKQRLLALCVCWNDPTAARSVPWTSPDIWGVLARQADAAAWERQVYKFAQRRALPALAPFIPTSAPRLRQTAYEMVLSAFLLDRSAHGALLDLVHAWPPDCYNAANFNAAVLQRCGGRCGCIGEIRVASGGSLPASHEPPPPGAIAACHGHCCQSCAGAVDALQAVQLGNVVLYFSCAGAVDALTPELLGMWPRTRGFQPWVQGVIVVAAFSHRPSHKSIPPSVCLSVHLWSARASVCLSGCPAGCLPVCLSADRALPAVSQDPVAGRQCGRPAGRRRTLVHGAGPQRPGARDLPAPEAAQRV